MKRLLWIVTILACSAQPALAQEPDWNDYDTLLKQYVSPVQRAGVDLNGVNYGALKQDARFGRVVAALERFPLAELQTREERLAFYINAYNILALKTVLDHWPVKSIKDTGSLLSPVWKKTAGRLGGKDVSLDQIEHGTLRPMGEPRIHMAIVCASISCPDLRAEAYTAARLDAQLDEQARSFLANRAKGLALDGGTARVSRIFDWFGKDFDTTYGGVEAFIRRYTDLPAGIRLKADLPYDWSLNGQ